MNEQDITHLLTVSDEEQVHLFAQARQARSHAFGNRIVLRGVVEVSNLCRVNCDYCASVRWRNYKWEDSMQG